MSVADILFMLCAALIAVMIGYAVRDASSIRPGELGVAYSCGHADAIVGHDISGSWCAEYREIYYKQLGTPP